MTNEVETPDNDAIKEMTDIQLLDALDTIQGEKDRIQKEIATRIMSRKQSK